LCTSRFCRLMDFYVIYGKVQNKKEIQSAYAVSVTLADICLLTVYK